MAIYNLSEVENPLKVQSMEGYYGICVAYIANYPIKNKALVPKL